VRRSDGDYGTCAVFLKKGSASLRKKDFLPVTVCGVWLACGVRGSREFVQGAGNFADEADFGAGDAEAEARKEATSWSSGMPRDDVTALLLLLHLWLEEGGGGCDSSLVPRLDAAPRR